MDNDHMTREQSGDRHPAVPRTSWIRHWSVVAVLLAVAFALGLRTSGPVESSQVAASQDKPEEQPAKETVIVQQINPPAIAITPTANKAGVRCIAIVGSADGRYWLVGEDGLATCVHDGRHDLYWWSDKLATQTLIQH